MERDKIKKKKKKKVLNVSPVEEEEVVIKKKKKNKQTCSCPVRDAQESRKKKLKKKHRNEIVEEHQEIILENSVNEKRKKKKHENEGLSEPLTEENESPGKKEKKKKKKENFRSDNEVDDSEIISTPKKKKHKKKHAEQADDSEIISTPKKKKRKNKHNEQNERNIDVELNIDKQEKDINEADESEIISTPKKKKSKKQHAEQVDDSEIISTPKKKKQKKKKREQNESDVSMVLPEEEAEENYVKEGKHKSKKKKKRDLENIIPEDESKGPDDVMKNYEKKKGSKRKPLTESTKVVERENGSGDGWRENGSGEPPTKKKKNKFNKETADHSCERDSHLILLEEEKNEKSGGSRPDSGDIVNCYSVGQADKKQEPSAAEVFVNAMDSIVIDSGDEVDVNVHQEESRQTNDHHAAIYIESSDDETTFNQSSMQNSAVIEIYDSDNEDINISQEDTRELDQSDNGQLTTLPNEESNEANTSGGNTDKTKQVSSSGMFSRYREVYITNAKYESNNRLNKHPYLLDQSKTKKDIIEAGVNCMFGAWTQMEMDTLQNNIERYKLKHRIEDFGQYFRTVVIPNRQVIDVSVKLSTGIFRRVQNIYTKLYQMYSSKQSERGGFFTPEEIEKLLMLQKRHGNKWTLIGKIMGRRPHDLSNFHHNKHSAYQEKGSMQINSIKQRTHFLPAEDELLVSIIKQQAQNQDGRIEENKIDWLKTAKELKTRSANACKSRWQVCLSTNFNNELYKTTDVTVGSNERMLIQRDLNHRILKLFIEENVVDKKDIDWKRVALHVGGNYNPRTICQRFLKFIERHATGLFEGTFRQQLLDIWSTVKLSRVVSI